ncbi:hypothetical protein B0T16DRAFT_2959 [Cercophora newfieldiana]|uniref:Reverse transcriptase zinc-binding domain-containing protein n=1 Tax=Cercophora newfieldiana TaxID=92897 RepID=A0AA39YNS0_9PEZI|nr:hypothetical protein B0T16DRAFT_2959 [Cercophora newfieldiana]
MDWDNYRRSRDERSANVNLEVPPLVEPWSFNCIQAYYKGLTRAQSTMLLHLRTGVIGLRRVLFRMHLALDRVDSPLCECGTSNETALHHLVQCPLLSAQRQVLCDQVKDFSFLPLVTKHADLATVWAIMFFGIEQFNSAKEYLSRPGTDALNISAGGKKLLHSIKR